MKIILIIFMVLLNNIINIYAEDNSRKFEELEIPGSSFNTHSTPIVYKLQYKHTANFLINIKNELIYNPAYDQAKAAIRFGDNEGDKLFEIIMYGEPSKRLSILLLIDKELGYVKYYENDNAWFNDKILGISFTQNDKLSIHNGQRNIMDRFNIGMFTLDTIEVYGKVSATDPDSIIGGNLRVEIFSGDPFNNPISLIPIIGSAIAGIVVIILLKLKRR